MIEFKTVRSSASWPNRKVMMLFIWYRIGCDIMKFNDVDHLAMIHSIESFGTVDGPGIRYVVFFQGCMLRCKYCHNRDTWETNTGTIREVEDLIAEVKKYKNYIVPSKGGVTASGGEPLLQAKFVAHFFKRLHDNDFHTALDTSGNFPITEDIKKVLKYTDLVLLDIKHIDNDKCKELTGIPNYHTLDFARYLSDHEIPMWIRQVIVPGITDQKEDLLKLKDFISTLKNVEKIELLPYHSMGKFKWENLGLRYPLEGVRDANQEDIKKAKEILAIT